MAIKRFSWVILLFIGIFVFAGCSKDVAAPEPEPVAEAPAEPQEHVPEILDADVPERDPFAAGGGPEWQKESGTVEAEGRDPFLADAGTSEWEAQRGDVDAKGRDPFAKVPNETTEPTPVEPGDDPVDPGEPPVVPVDPGEEPLPGIVTVVLQTTVRCWLDVFVDDVRVLRTNVPSAETLRWEAQREVRLDQVGREMAVRVNVNDKDLGLLGELVQQLGEDSVLVDREAGVEISLERRYPGGVLVGLRFTALKP